VKIRVLLAVIAIGVVFAILFWPTEENKIKKNLDSLAQYSSTENGESVIDVMQKVASASRLFKDPCAIRVEAYAIDHSLSRKEISDRMLMMKKRLPDTKFTFHDSMVNLTTGISADVTTTLRLEGEIDADEFTDAYEINAKAEKIEGEWRFSSFTVIEFMEK